MMLKLICNAQCQEANTYNMGIVFSLKGILKELWNQSPALATLIYVDWLPTGQWSAVSATVYSRGSQIVVPSQSLRRSLEP